MTDIIQPNAELTRPKIRVAIGVPAGDHVCTGFAFDLARMTGATVKNRPDIELRLYTAQGTILPKSRHELVLAAFQSDSTHLFFLDSDMRFPKTILAQLLAHGEPIVAANYATRKLPITTVSMASDTDHTQRVYTETGQVGLEEVASTGMGAMLIDMDVFRNIEMPWFQTGFVSSGDYVGEDVYFCRKVREAGIKILIDHAVSQEVAHIGEFVYRHEHALGMRQQLVVAGDHDGD